jgi:methionyl-tRNA formyltransferase
MKVLLLGPYRKEIINYLNGCDDTCISTEEKINSNSTLIQNIDFLVSYGYRYILREEVLQKFPNKAINIHISFLPWNRGSDPNLWSFLEDTPKGVTIHYLDSGIDTGAILVQKEFNLFSNEDTLRSTYIKLSEMAVDLFMTNWINIRKQNLIPVPQTGEKSYHSLKDKNKYERFLTQGWDTPVAQIQGKAFKN